MTHKLSAAAGRGGGHECRQERHLDGTLVIFHATPWDTCVDVLLRTRDKEVWKAFGACWCQHLWKIQVHKGISEDEWTIPTNRQRGVWPRKREAGKSWLAFDI